MPGGRCRGLGGELSVLGTRRVTEGPAVPAGAGGPPGEASTPVRGSTACLLRPGAGGGTGDWAMPASSLGVLLLGIWVASGQSLKR